MKRKADDDNDDNDAMACKKQRLANPTCATSDLSAKSPQPRHRIRKLVPPRPWPNNPNADNPTGPRSAKEGKNYINLTRKTALGAYMRRCKALILDDGYTSIYLSAMGAAIPHLMQLACTLPGILPYPRNEIFMDVETGTVEVQDEVLPDSLDEDMVYNTRCKSTLKVTFTIGKGGGTSKRRRVGKGFRASDNVVTETHVLEEPEQEEERPSML